TIGETAIRAATPAAAPAHPIRSRSPGRTGSGGEQHLGHDPESVGGHDVRAALAIGSPDPVGAIVSAMAAKPGGTGCSCNPIPTWPRLSVFPTAVSSSPTTRTSFPST